MTVLPTDKPRPNPKIKAPTLKTTIRWSREAKIALQNSSAIAQNFGAGENGPEKSVSGVAKILSETSETDSDAEKILSGVAKTRSDNGASDFEAMESAREVGRIVRAAGLWTLQKTLENSRLRVFPALRNFLNTAPQSRFFLDVQMVNDGQIQVLNRDFRGKDRATDVLSFGFWEGEMPDLELEIVPLGDLILSIETARRQAQDLKHTLSAELGFLTIHGVLHLLGLDHDTPARRKTMFAWQDELFAEFLERFLKD